MTVLCFSDTLQFHVTPASLHRMLQKVPQTRYGFKHASVLNSWATDYQLKLDTNSMMKNRKFTNFIRFKKTLWIYTPFFMSPTCFWFSDEFVVEKEPLQTQNSLIVLDVPNLMSQIYCCRLRKSGHCKVHKILLLPVVVAVRGKEAQKSNSKSCCTGEAQLPSQFLWLPQLRDCWYSRLGIQQAREAGGRSCKERLC